MIEELDASILFLIFILESIKQFSITIEFWILQFFNLELLPMLTFGPIIEFSPIVQFSPIIHGPNIFELVEIFELFPDYYGSHPV